MTSTDPLTGQRLADNHGTSAGEGPNYPGGQTRCDAQTASAAGAPDTRNGQRTYDTQIVVAVAGPTSEPATTASTPRNGPPVRDPAGNGHVTPDTQHARAVAVNPPAPTNVDTLPSAGSSGLAAPLDLTDHVLNIAAAVLDDLERVRIANENRLRQLTRVGLDKDGLERGFGLTMEHPAVARLDAIVKLIAKAEHDATLNLQRQLRAHPLGPWARSIRGLGDKQVARLLAAVGDPYIRPAMIGPDGTVEPARPRRVSELMRYCGYGDIHRLPAGQLVPDTQGFRADGGTTSARQTSRDAQVSLAGGAQPPIGHIGRVAQCRPAGGDQRGSDPGHSGTGTQVKGAGVAATRTRGQRIHWSPEAKSRLYVIAEACMKQLAKPCAVDETLGYAVHVADCRCSPYRRVYDAARAKYADAIHPAQCVRCGPAGSPALAGSKLSDAHKLARALRAVSKAIVRDLWREARRLHNP